LNPETHYNDLIGEISVDVDANIKAPCSHILFVLA